jgi:ABC-type polysaccharide/polyol phosphate export permease
MPQKQGIWASVPGQVLRRVMRFLRISLIELSAESRVTALGIFWVPLTTILFSLVLALLFHPLSSGSQSQFFLYVLVGYSLWQFVAATLNSSIDLMRRQFDNAVHNGLNLSGLYLKALSDRAVELGLNLATCLVATALLNVSGLGMAVILLIPALTLVLMMSLAISYMVSLVATLAPDVGRLIKTSTRFLFFISPVFWSPASTDQAIRQLIYSFNPASYYLEIMRQAFGIEEISILSWAAATAITLVCAMASWVLFIRTRNMITNIK